jgi:hypothetical protein
MSVYALLSSAVSLPTAVAVRSCALVKRGLMRRSASVPGV